MPQTNNSPAQPPRHDFHAILPVSDGVVSIRLMTGADADAYAAGTDDALVKRFAHLPLENYTPQIVRDLIEGAIADGLKDGSLAVLAISDAVSGSFMGSLVFFDIRAEDAEIGYWVCPEHRGRNISSHALALAAEIAHALGLKALRARTVEDNPASTKVLLRAGFEQLGEATPQTVPSGKTEMSLDYRIALAP